MKKSDFIKTIEYITVPTAAAKLLREMQEHASEFEEWQFQAIQKKINKIGTQDKRFLIFVANLNKPTPVLLIVAHFDTKEKAVAFVPPKNTWDDYEYEIYDRIEGCIVDIE